jgi:fumarate hydratase subunit beta
MDDFVPVLLKNGLLGMIGKGERSIETAKAIKKAGAVYFTAPGGAGAYLSEKVKESRIAAYEDLGTEAIRRLIIKDFPVIVSIP